MDHPLRLRPVRSLPPSPNGPVLEVVTEDAPRRRFVLWPHPVKSEGEARAIEGQVDGQPRWLQHLPAGTSEPAATAGAPADAPILVFSPVASSVAESVDEVGFDLGPEEEAHGLLDAWARITGETQGEATGSLSEGESLLQQRYAAIVASRRPVAERIRADDASPSSEVKALIADEPLDALPVPDGVSLAPNPWSPEPDPTTDITAIRVEVTVETTPERTLPAVATDPADERTLTENPPATIAPTRLLIIAAAIGLLAIIAAFVALMLTLPSKS